MSIRVLLPCRVIRGQRLDSRKIIYLTFSFFLHPFFFIPPLHRSRQQQAQLAGKRSVPQPPAVYNKAIQPHSSSALACAFL